jgi:phage terminase Nu1 subunit (DNA packaging protein)
MVSKWSKEMGCPRNGEKGSYNLAEVLAWYLDLKGLRASPLSTLTDEEREDPEMVEAVLKAMPAAQQLAHWRARREELKFNQEKGRLVERGVVYSFLMTVAGQVRGLGEKLQHRFGVDAVDMLNEALDEVEAQIDGQLGGEEA